LTFRSYEQASAHELLELTSLRRRPLDLRRQQSQKLTLEARECRLVALRERPGQVQVLDVQLRKLALGICGGCQPLAKICRRADFSLIQLITPTTPRERAVRIANSSSGFLYYVSVTGITGERTQLPPELLDNVSWLRTQTRLPICIGFGISQPEHVKLLAPVADGLIVGSAIVRRIADAATKPRPTVLTDPTGLKTYDCTAPLHAAPWAYGAPLLYHEYLCVVGADGKETCVGQDREGNGFWSPGKPSNDTKAGGDCKEVEPDNSCIEQCILTEGAAPRPRYGIGPQGTDCQEWADDTLSKCRKQCKPKK